MGHHAPFTPRAVKLIAGYRLFKVLRSIRVCNLRIVRPTPPLNSSYPRVNDGNREIFEARRVPRCKRGMTGKDDPRQTQPVGQIRMPYQTGAPLSLWQDLQSELVAGIAIW